MFRKALFPLLCAASFADAIPLKVGESWVWQVWDRDSTTSTYKTARVLESSPCEQGTVWLVLGRDSLTQHQDTAKILERKNGRQSWLRASKNLAFELMPYSASDSDTVVVLGSDTSYQWGQVSSFPDLKASSLYRNSDSNLESTSKVISPWIFQGDLSFQYQYAQLPLPRGVWCEVHGWERFVSWPRSTAGIEWKLLLLNGEQAGFGEIPFRIPLVGTKFTWSGVLAETNVFMGIPSGRGTSITMDHSQISGVFSWQIKEILPDSADWKRLEVFEESVLNPDSNSSTVKRIDVSIRLNTLTGQDFQSSLASLPFQKNWVAHFDDSIETREDHAQVLFSKSLGSVDNFRQTLTLRRYIRNEDTLFFQRDDSRSSLTSSQQIKTSSFRLLRMEAPPRDSFAFSLRSRSNKANLSLQELIQQHPNLSVRWIRPSGQQGMGPASTLVSASFPHRRQILRLEARLPDGQAWTSSQVLP
ncbi:MAG: hypothetical protein IPK50_04525 [Fibrobacterota bacterium]|nr:hypothetical protein [Fibrobacterota bacterium]QQS06161.1 MAG: hypothetical protein IPK50_04525 [Fibrobacterota bacterium]